MIFAASTDNYFLALLAAYLKGETPPAIPRDIDWEKMVTLGQKHRLAPMLVAALPAGAPQTARDTLQQQARQRRIRTMVMSRDYQALQDAFRAATVPFVPIKGIAIAHTHYPSPTMRYFDDLDILIPADAGPQALAILNSLGYKPHPNAGVPEWHHLAPHVHARHATMVEIHTDLLRRTGPGWALSGIWDRTVDGTLEGQTTRMLSPADALLYAVQHARHNLFHRLATFIDIGYLAEAVVAADEVDQLYQLAGEASALQILGYSLYELDRMFAWRPFAVQQRRFALNQRTRARLDRQVGWHSLDLAERPGHDGPLARLREARLTDSWSASLHYLRHLLFPPAEFVQETYGAGGYTSRLVKRAGVALGQLLSR